MAVAEEHFIKVMRARREELGVSQQAVANRVGLSRTSVTNIEAGRQPLSLASALEIAAMLDLTLGEMVGEITRL